MEGSHASQGLDFDVISYTHIILTEQDVKLHDLLDSNYEVVTIRNTYKEFHGYIA